MKISFHTSFRTFIRYTTYAFVLVFVSVLSFVGLHKKDTSPGYSVDHSPPPTSSFIDTSRADNCTDGCDGDDITDSWGQIDGTDTC